MCSDSCSPQKRIKKFTRVGSNRNPSKILTVQSQRTCLFSTKKPNQTSALDLRCLFVGGGEEVEWWLHLFFFPYSNDPHFSGLLGNPTSLSTPSKTLPLNCQPFNVQVTRRSDPRKERPGKRNFWPQPNWRRRKHPAYPLAIQGINGFFVSTLWGIRKHPQYITQCSGGPRQSRSRIHCGLGVLFSFLFFDIWSSGRMQGWIFLVMFICRKVM